MKSAGHIAIAAAIVWVLGLLWGLFIFSGADEAPQCVPCSCASEPYSYPPSPYVNAPYPME